MKASNDRNTDHIDKDLKLHNAVLACNIAKVSEYCNKAESINIIDDLNTAGLAAIHIAINNKNEELVNLLLEGGANPNKATSKGESPIILAIMAAAPEILTRLIEGHADVNMLDPQGNSPLKVATDLKNHACAEILREHGALFVRSRSSLSTTTTKAVATSGYVEAIISAVQNCIKDSAKFVSFKEFYDRILCCTEEYISLSPSLLVALKADLESPLNDMFNKLIKLSNGPAGNIQKDSLNIVRKIIVAINSQAKPHLLKSGDHSSICLMSRAESIIEDKVVKAKSCHIR